MAPVVLPLSHARHVGRWAVRGLPRPWRNEVRLLARRWDTRNPVTFTDKIRYKMARDRRPIVTTFAGKVEARSYVAGVVGAEYLTTLYLATSSPDDLKPDRLPREFVLKASHLSGGVLLVHEGAPRGPMPRFERPLDRKVVHPDDLDWSHVRRVAASWLKITYGFENHLEPAYWRVPKQVLAEELLRHPDGALADDYKFFVLNGVVRLVQVDHARLGEHRRDLFTPEWEALDVRQTYDRAPSPPPRPEHLEEMLSVASRLGQETDFVRVDLYEANGRVVFGELTNYPGAATIRFEPASFDVELGRHLAVPKRYR